jgi:lipoprotein-anchoring transpeptidase ErfK/SrfK
MKAMKIDFNELGEGTLLCEGYRSFRCLGRRGVPYPQKSTIDPSRPGTKENPHYSNTYSCSPNNDRNGRCVMRFSILIWGQQGIFIHEWPTPATYAGNGGPTHGCIHVDPGNAALVYGWVDRPTKLLISYPG